MNTHAKLPLFVSEFRPRTSVGIRGVSRVYKYPIAPFHSFIKKGGYEGEAIAPLGETLPHLLSISVPGI